MLKLRVRMENCEIEVSDSSDAVSSTIRIMEKTVKEVKGMHERAENHAFMPGETP